VCAKAKAVFLFGGAPENSAEASSFSVLGKNERSSKVSGRLPKDQHIGTINATKRAQDFRGLPLDLQTEKNARAWWYSAIAEG